MVGTRRLREAGKYAGQPNQKSHKLVGSSYVVAARKAAEDIASVRRLLCSALRFVWPWTLHRLTTVTII